MSDIVKQLAEQAHVAAIQSACQDARATLIERADEIKSAQLHERILQCFDYDDLVATLDEIEPSAETSRDYFITACYVASESCKTKAQLDQVREKLFDILSNTLDFNVAQSDNQTLQSACDIEPSESDFE